MTKGIAVEALIVSNILLWIVVLVLGVVVFALTRQIGVLYERVAPAGALMVNKQLRVGMKAPVLMVPDIMGKQYLVGGRSDTLKSQLLFFVSPECPVCKSLLPAVKSVANSEADWLAVTLASDGPTDHQGLIDEYQLSQFAYLVSEELGIRYGVSKLPYAVLINESGKISSMGIVNSREHLESLFEAKERNIASIQDYIEQQAS